MNKTNPKNTFVNQKPLTTPVLFLIFNRPDVTRRVFSAIREAQPPRLYVAGDGPHLGNQEEEKRCKLARSVVDEIDWRCEVKTLFRKENLGCRKAVSEAISWFFEHEPEGIILEDDCLPSQSFLWYCQELLEHYRDDMRIMHIGGANFQFGRNRSPYDYYFSRYPHVWGWASWRRSWKYYRDIEHWSPEILYKIFRSMESNYNFIRFWESVHQKVKSGEIDTWDHQWTFSCWAQNGLAIVPDINLVSNIGFGEDSTHTKVTSHVSKIPAQEIRLPLHHPHQMVRLKDSDSYTEMGQYFKPFFLRIISKLYQTVGIKYKYY